MVKGKIANCFNRQTLAGYEHFSVALAHSEYFLHNRPTTGASIALKPAQFIIANIIKPMAQDSMTAKEIGNRFVIQGLLFDLSCKNFQGIGQDPARTFPQSNPLIRGVGLINSSCTFQPLEKLAFLTNSCLYNS
jgi:hypothetical protein